MITSILRSGYAAKAGEDNPLPSIKPPAAAPVFKKDRLFIVMFVMNSSLFKVSLLLMAPLLTVFAC
jgi:hypothetical protein